MHDLKLKTLILYLRRTCRRTVPVPNLIVPVSNRTVINRTRSVLYHTHYRTKFRTKYSIIIELITILDTVPNEFNFLKNIFI